jgi:1-acyl-sn-glycerol-3-phosphate acyltransferase
MLSAAKRAVAAGRPIAIFPQGTRTAPGEHRPYQPGVAALYQGLGVPLVPAAVNSGLFWGRRSFVKRPGRIVLSFLPPIPPGRSPRAVMTELETRIETATAALEKEGMAAYGEGRRGAGNQSSSPLPRIWSSE